MTAVSAEDLPITAIDPVSTNIVEKSYPSQQSEEESSPSNTIWVSADGVIEELKPGSFLDLYIQYANTCLPGVHRDYHLLVALVIQASVLGHKLTTDTNLQTNIAGVIVTVQGIGKS